MFEIWLKPDGTGGDWGRVLAWEERKKIVETKEQTIQSWLILDQLVDLYHNRGVAEDLVQVYCRDEKRWRPHPVIPWNLDAVQCLCDTLHQGNKKCAQICETFNSLNNIGETFSFLNDKKMKYLLNPFV